MKYRSCEGGSVRWDLMDEEFISMYSAKLLRFVENEFARLDAEICRPKKAFSFSVKHCIRGTTAVWGKAEKFSTPRHLTTAYTYTLGKLINGEAEIPGYHFEQVTLARKATYRVTRVPTVTQEAANEVSGQVR